ncbi:SdpI family protein [Halomonas faecis]|uniref:SdpI family protein n=1 Tax=Halomonas faecis TaxID=1562110 RepID=UPI0013D6B2A0|nr:SdpI family protein [Halomonas faecis]
MNGIYGVRTKYSYHCDEAWYEINAYGGKQFIFWSMILALVGVVAFFVELEDHPALTMLFAFAPLVLIVPAVMSWHYGKKLNVVEKR